VDRLMQELVIVTWCDVCRGRDEDPSKAELTLKVTVDGTAYGLDLCNAHKGDQVALADLAAFLEQYAIKGGDSPGPRPKTAEAVGELKPFKCPACERRYTVRGSLAAHARQDHNRPISALERDAGLVPKARAETPTLTCEICGTTARAAQGLAAHKRAAHGILGKAARERQAAQNRLVG
jgi:hypothetical protein